MSKNNDKNVMKEMTENQIVLKGEDGKEHKFDLLFTFDSDETGKSYMAYTDNQTESDGRIRVYASIYDPTGVDLNIYPITDEKEYAVINEILNSVQEQVQKMDNEEE